MTTEIETSKRKGKMKKLVIAGVSLVALAYGYSVLSKGLPIPKYNVVISTDGIEKLTVEEFQERYPPYVSERSIDRKRILDTQESIEGFVTSVETVAKTVFVKNPIGMGGDLELPKYSWVELDGDKTFLYPLVQNVPNGGHRISISYLSIVARDINPDVFDSVFLRPRNGINKREFARALDYDGVIIGYKYIEGRRSTE